MYKTYYIDATEIIEQKENTLNRRIPTLFAILEVPPITRAKLY